MKQKLTEELEIIEEVTIGLDRDTNTFKIKGPKGELEKVFNNPKVIPKIEGNKVIFESEKGTQKEKKEMKTIKAHLNNLMRGVKEGHVYKLKVCSGHFPMTVSVKGNVFEVKNFIGEHVPRTTQIPEGVNVKVDGQIIVVDGINKDVVSQTAGKIEQSTRRSGFDKRIFQDGIYIIEKDSKKI